MIHPQDPDDPDLNPGEYGFADSAPEKREGPPLKYDKYATSEPEEDEEEPRPQKRKQKNLVSSPNDEASNEEPAPKKPRRDLAEPPPPPQLLMTYPWYFWTIVLAGLGLVGLVIAAVYAGVKEGPAVGALALTGAMVAVLFETGCVAVLMVLIGSVFGIDYGPVKQGAVKLLGSVAFVNGFTLAFGLLCLGCFGPLGILMALSIVTLVCFVVFQSQFQLNIYESLITVLIIQGCAWLMATGLAFTVMNGIK